MSDISKMTLEQRREAMSALADGHGEAGTSVGATACALWAADTAARQAWHEYHLIGDVLRSQELAQPASKDADFLDAFRARLAAEPVVLAPAAMPATATPAPISNLRRWIAPAAVAAGFVAVAAVLVVTQVIAPQAESGAVLATSAAPTLVSTSQSLAPAGVGALGFGDPQLQVVEGKLVRDARLDAYLRAHNGGAAALPGRVTGRFEAVVLER